jgi:hypothetical protein
VTDGYQAFFISSIDFLNSGAYALATPQIDGSVRWLTTTTYRRGCVGNRGFGDLPTGMYNRTFGANYNL